MKIYISGPITERDIDWEQRRYEIARDVDSNRYALGNYYPTREMAERQAERILAILATPCTDTTFTGR